MAASRYLSVEASHHYRAYMRLGQPLCSCLTVSLVGARVQLALRIVGHRIENMGKASH